MIKEIVLQGAEARKKMYQVLNISNGLLSMPLSFKCNRCIGRCVLSGMNNRNDE